ncbi:MAG TPA: TatD family hydrolase [Chlamydiales bacterium]
MDSRSRAKSQDLTFCKAALHALYCDVKCFPMFFDSHAHLSSQEILPQVESVLERARAASVRRMINICTDRESLESGLLIAQGHRDVLNAGATTPHDVCTEGELNFPLFEKAAAAGQLVAVGETGLDYHYDYSDKKTQGLFLVRYLHLAAEHKLPVIFHCREAFADLFSIVDAEYPKEFSAILHCFTGTMREAEQVIARGWSLSLSGIVTFKKSEELRLVAKEIPLKQLLIETDSPYLAPQSRRGQPNEPAFIGETARCIAALRNESLETVAQATFENASRVFRLPN